SQRGRERARRTRRDAHRPHAEPVSSLAAVVLRQYLDGRPLVDFVIECTTGSRMLTVLLVLLRSIGLICRGHRAVALENLALRQQLTVLTRTVTRPALRPRDRLFWILLSKGW